MKVTKKQQWAPIVIELETIDELRILGDVLAHAIVHASFTFTGRAIHSFACKLNHELSEVSK